MQHADGEILAARAAKAFGIPFTLSTMSICSLEDIAEHTGRHPFWFQLYVMRDRDFMERLIDRAKAANCSALQLTLDLQVMGLGNVLYAKAQTSDAFAIRTTPLWFTMHSDFVAAPVLHGALQDGQLVLRWPADAAPYRLQEAAECPGAYWTDAVVEPVCAGEEYRVAVPGAAGNRFYRLTR